MAESTPPLLSFLPIHIPFPLVVFLPYPTPTPLDSPWPTNLTACRLVQAVIVLLD